MPKYFGDATKPPKPRAMRSPGPPLLKPKFQPIPPLKDKMKSLWKGSQEAIKKEKAKEQAERLAKKTGTKRA